MSKVLVTGATGNVGAEVVDRLARCGVDVIAAVRPGRVEAYPAHQDAASGRITPVAFDFDDRTTFQAALDGVDRVFLMRPPDMSDARAFAPFVDAMTRARVRQVVFLSVQGAGQNVFVPHHGIETLLKRSRLTWTFLRPSFFMQNLTTTHVADVRDRDEIFVPAGNGRTNFIDVADVAEAAVVCLTSDGHAGRAYEITGSEALTYAEVAAILSRACGRPITYAKPSGRAFKARMLAEGHDADFVRVMGSIYAIARFGMAAGTTDDFEVLTGHAPRTLAEWAARNVTCWSPERDAGPVD